MFKTAQEMILNFDPMKTKFVRGAPRGHGKSRIISVVFPLWCICFKYRQNIMLIADTNAQSKEYVSTIKAELEDNALLIRDFGNLAGDVKWREDEIVTANDIHIAAKSSGQSLRGASYKNIRPELVILDDLENDENVETEAQRKKLKDWFEKVLMPIGNPRTVFLYVGSVLHYESLLYTILTDPKYSEWNRKIYTAVKEFSSETELWQQWEDIFTDLKRETPAKDANDFFMKNVKKMMSGVDILWNGRNYQLFNTEDKTEEEKMELSRDSWYQSLMILKLQNDEAFNSEYQNNPMTEESRTFKTEWIESNYYTDPPKMKEIYASVDVSMGNSRTSDTSAIIVVGRGIDNYFYVLDADVKRRRPDVIINDCIRIVNKYGKDLNGFIVETNVFQEFFAKTMKDQCVKMGLYVNWIEVKSMTAKDNKQIRIRSLAPKIKQGYIKFNAGHRVLISQLKNYPKDHDDAPDALERCINQFASNNGKICVSSLHGKRNELTSMLSAKKWKQVR